MIERLKLSCPNCDGHRDIYQQSATGEDCWRPCSVCNRTGLVPEPWEDFTTRLQTELDRRNEESERIKKVCSEALGYTGDHTAETWAMEAAKKIKKAAHLIHEMQKASNEDEAKNAEALAHRDRAMVELARLNTRICICCPVPHRECFYGKNDDAHACITARIEWAMKKMEE